MARKVVVVDSEPAFGIRCTYSDGTTGFITGASGKPMAFSTEADAEKMIKQFMKTKHYSWNGCDVKVDQISF